MWHICTILIWYEYWWWKFMYNTGLTELYFSKSQAFSQFCVVEACDITCRRMMEDLHWNFLVYGLIVLTFLFSIIIFQRFFDCIGHYDFPVTHRKSLFYVKLLTSASHRKYNQFLVYNIINFYLYYRKPVHTVLSLIIFYFATYTMTML